MGIAHAAFWGFQTVLFLFSFFGTWINGVFAFHIEILLSNINYLIYLFGIVLLLVDAIYANDG